MNQAGTITLQEAVRSAASQWGNSGPSAIDKLQAQLAVPGGKASVVSRFINGRYVTPGSRYCDASTLINRFSTHRDIDEAFDAVLSFLEQFGELGIELANAIRLQNQHRLNNYEV